MNLVGDIQSKAPRPKQICGCINSHRSPACAREELWCRRAHLQMSLCKSRLLLQTLVYGESRSRSTQPQRSQGLKVPGVFQTRVFQAAYRSLNDSSHPHRAVLSCLHLASQVPGTRLPPNLSHGVGGFLLFVSPTRPAPPRPPPPSLHPPPLISVGGALHPPTIHSPRASGLGLRARVKCDLGVSEYRGP